ncbi:helix-turn-helix domain-containing protein [Streptomyces sp. NPDC052396]|uniref:helix-turn-helix domain-containing protein n=1 Tax=Streptomyces sp. NPDC052396 TaxID=3365689 RepID=UPI0037D886AC
MPRWRALPDDLDPQVRAFTEQLRRLVERSGMGIGAVADRTGYSKTSWERYLNGRLLPPRGAVEALAEVTDTNAAHLGTLWELAERAWSRAELRHDVTMEAGRVAEARAALSADAPYADVPSGDVPSGEAPSAEVPKVPEAPATPQPRPKSSPLTASGVDVRDKAIPLTSERRPSGPRRRTGLLAVIGVVGAALVVVAAMLLLGGSDDAKKAGPPPSAAPGTTQPASGLSDRARCDGAACNGKDPESMGCGGQYASTAGSATVGTSYLEVRYSKSCGTAWARITQGTPGDTLKVTAATLTGRGRIQRGTDGHTTMVAVSGPEQARACAVLRSGRTGCTVAHTGSTAPLASPVTGG